MFEVNHDGRTILDVVSSVVELEPVELEGYSYSIGSGPKDLFGFGYEYEVRRPGVVHASRVGYERFKERLHDAFQNDIALYRHVVRKYLTCRSALESAFTGNVFNHALSLQELWTHHVVLMAFTCLNWLFPTKDILAGIGRMVGAQGGSKHLAALLCVSDEVPHFIQIELDRAITYMRLHAGDTSSCADHSLKFGHWYEMEFWEAPFESAEYVERDIRGAFDGLSDALSRHARLTETQQSSHRKRDDWKHFLHLRTGLSDADERRLRLASDWLQFVCAAEEFRHKMQRNVMRALRTQALGIGLRKGDVTAEALGLRSLHIGSVCGFAQGRTA